MIGKSFFVDLPEAIHEYRLIKEIGHGSYSVVFLVEKTTDNKYYACKILSKQFLIDKQAVSRFKSECNILSSIEHQNIVRFHELISDDDLLYLFFEYCPCGDLQMFVMDHKKLSEDLARRLFSDICSGLNYLHNKGIAHRDIKLSNILLDENYRAKIADFGFSKDTNEQSMLKTKCGSPIYIAPEIIQEQSYDGMMSDMWALGVILFIMTVGTVPWTHVSNEKALLIEICEARYHLPDNLSNNLRDLISSLMRPQPLMRYTPIQVLSHPWVNNISSSIHNTYFSSSTRKGSSFSEPKRQDITQQLLLNNQATKSRGDNLMNRKFSSRSIPISEKIRKGFIN